MRSPVYRYLKGYVFDPGFSSTLEHRLGNEVIYKIRWEKVSEGPLGEYVEVIDYDPTKGVFYEAVNLDEPGILAEQGMPLSEDDPKFHQQQVYAVVMRVIETFEKALGRKIIFSRLLAAEHPTYEYRQEYVPRLRVYPHAMRQQNAFYSPEKIALLFGYFRAAPQWNGNNIPNTAIFTCLSPDIVAHECTHAVLDSMHPYLNRDTNPDMLAFHEGFADIIALLQRFTFRKVVEEQIRNSRGDLYAPENFLGDLAIQFGNAVSGSRRALRSYLVTSGADGKTKVLEPDPSQYASLTEPHARGALLVAAVFNAFARLYKYKVAELIRLASDGSGILRPGAIPEDLVKCLSKTAAELAEKLTQVCIRALDYCPPVDLNFGDYLRALVTTDVEYNPADEEDLRYALLESFRSWGLVPYELTTYSVSSLMWKSLDEWHAGHPLLAKLKSSIAFIFNQDDSGEAGKCIERILRYNDREEIFKGIAQLSGIVHRMFDQKFNRYAGGIEHLLGMSFSAVTYTLGAEENKSFVLKAAARNKFQVYRCRPVLHTNPVTGHISKHLLITFLQKVFVNVKGSPYEGYFPNEQFEFRGGCTLVIDLSNYEVKYAVVKSVSSAARLQKQLEYAMLHAGHSNSELLLQEKEPFAAVHFH